MEPEKISKRSVIPFAWLQISAGYRTAKSEVTLGYDNAENHGIAWYMRVDVKID